MKYKAQGKTISGQFGINCHYVIDPAMLYEYSANLEKQLKTFSAHVDGSNDRLCIINGENCGLSPIMLELLRTFKKCAIIYRSEYISSRFHTDTTVRNMRKELRLSSWSSPKSTATLKKFEDICSTGLPKVKLTLCSHQKAFSRRINPNSFQLIMAFPLFSKFT